MFSTFGRTGPQQKKELPHARECRTAARHFLALYSTLRHFKRLIGAARYSLADAYTASQLPIIQKAVSQIK